VKIENQSSAPVFEDPWPWGLRRDIDKGELQGGTAACVSVVPFRVPLPGFGRSEFAVEKCKQYVDGTRDSGR